MDLRQSVNAYHTHSKGTGGGPNLPESPLYEWIISILGMNGSQILDGVKGMAPSIICIPLVKKICHFAIIMNCHGKVISFFLFRNRFCMLLINNKNKVFMNKIMTLLTAVFNSPISISTEL